MFETYAESGKDIDNLLLDGMHPNDTWHKILAEILAEEIEIILK